MILVGFGQLIKIVTVVALGGLVGGVILMYENPTPAESVEQCTALPPLLDAKFRV